VRPGSVWSRPDLVKRENSIAEVCSRCHVIHATAYEIRPAVLEGGRALAEGTPVRCPRRLRATASDNARCGHASRRRGGGRRARARRAAGEGSAMRPQRHGAGRVLRAVRTNVRAASRNDRAQPLRRTVAIVLCDLARPHGSLRRDLPPQRGRVMMLPGRPCGSLSAINFRISIQSVVPRSHQS
jgi:hypothetical protein